MAKVLSCVLLSVAVPSCSAASVPWWQSSKSTDDRLSKKADLPLAEKDTATTTITVDASEGFQKILGFGGAFTQSSATVFKALPEELQAQVLTAYFSTEEGLGYTTGRLPIHSCDFSTESYTFDDSEGDYSLADFDTTVAYDANLSIPMITAALKVNADLKLFGSPWSPPAWMKTNGQMSGGGSLVADAASAWALYFSKWIGAYEAQGVPIWGVTVQNEPEAAQPWESCVYSPEEEAAFVRDYLGPQLRADFPDAKILGFDHNKDTLVTWADTLLNGSASEYFDGIAFHWYAGNCLAHVQQVSTAYPDAIVLPSEACYELTQMEDDEAGDAWLANGTWARGEGYGYDILGDLNSGSNGWTDWNLILDQEGGPNHVNNFCDAPILADLRANHTTQLYFHPQYFYLGHFSKFLLPDSQRVSATVTGADATDDSADDCTGWPACKCHSSTPPVVA